MSIHFPLSRRGLLLAALLLLVTQPAAASDTGPWADSAPTVFSVSPTEGYNHKSTDIAITGSNFVTTPTVHLNNVPLSNVTLVDASTLTATVPADLPGGVYALTVTNPDTQNTSLPDAFAVLLSGDGGLGNWTLTSPLNSVRSGLQTVSNGQHIYALGGWVDPGISSSVEQAKINPDGSLGHWQATTSMSIPRYGFRALAAGDYLYALGNNNIYNGASVEKARIQADGSLGPWESITAFPAVRFGHGAVVIGRHIYVIGGEVKADSMPSTSDSVLRAPILVDGTLGAWEAMASLLKPTTGRASAVGNCVYMLSNAGDVQYTSVNADSSLAAWQYTSPLTINRDSLGLAAVRGFLYALGGVGGNPPAVLASVERARVNSDCSLGAWSVVASLTTPRWILGATAANNHLYAIGGQLASSVELAEVNAIMLESISPTVVPAGRRTAVSLHGNNFLPPPFLGMSAAIGPAVALTSTTFVSPTVLTTVVPADLSHGWYTATLTNGDGRVVSMTNALRVDGVKPVAEQVVINGGALSSTSTSVTLGLAASDGSDPAGDLRARLSNDGETWSAWQPYPTPVGWQLSSGDGLATVYAQVRDPATNESNIVSDTITLDTAAGDSYGLTINDGALFTNQTAVRLTIGALPGTAKMMVSNDGGFAGGHWEPYASRRAWTITQYGAYVMPRVVYIRYGDAGGNVLGGAQDDIILDVTPPMGTITIVVPAVVVNALSVSPSVDPISSSFHVFLPLVAHTRVPCIDCVSIQVLLNATDDVSGVGSMLLSNTDTFIDAQWEPYVQEKAWLVPAVGTTTVYVRFRDHAGNQSQLYSAAYMP